MGRRTEIVIALPYRPRPLQAELHRTLGRFNVLVAHRRFGKTVFCINELIAKAVANALVEPRYAYVAPFYRQAKSVAWDYLKHYTAPIPGVRHNESELRCDLPGGARIRLFGADDPDRLRGLYFDGVVLDEYAQMNPRVWSEVLRPALTDRKGWAIFIGTPMGRNGFWEIYDRATREPDWFAARFRASETGVIDAGELAAARAVMSEDEYAQEFECSFDVAVTGSYYGKLIAAAEGEGRIGKVPWEPALPVHTAWDLGVGDSTAIWFCQQAGREVRLIDYYEASGVGLDHYAKVLSAKPYAYGEHLLPHDVRVTELGTGKSRLETLAGLGLRARVVANLPVDDGIQAVRNLLPRCWVDAERCARGLEALRQYRREYDDKLKAFKARPLHDWTSHAADALRYLAVGLRPAEGAAAPIKYDNRWIV
ncbi:terminase large subunit domain-containing protein [Rhodospirillaceae bacterium SYSU D60014]|uniref:terminase large subunit domain-containing protein n=1 Tax=Virgifigura deserti TaxID=2268457 RepID=UPI000E673968